MKPRIPVQIVHYYWLRTDSQGKFRLYSNALDDFWEGVFSSFWSVGTKAVFVSDKISNTGQSEQVELPSSGYETYTINPLIPKVIKPAYYCHNFRWRPWDGISESQVDTFSFGKTGYGSFTWDSYLVVQPPQDLKKPCSGLIDWFLLSMTNSPRGLPALVGNDGHALIEMQNLIEVGNTPGIPAGRALVSNGQKISFENYNVTYGVGEQASHAAVNYKIARAVDQKVISEGAIQSITDVDLQPGQYVLRRWLAESPDTVFAETEFTVRNRAGTTLLPGLKNFLWNRNGSEVGVIISANLPLEDYLDSDISTLSFYLRKSQEADWLAVNIVPFDGKRSVWKGDFSIDSEVEKYEARISFSNQAGDLQNIYLKNPFSKK